MDIRAILQHLSVAEAQKLLDTAKGERERKEKEMQAMGGSRYQDLIDAADQIVSMHEASLRLDAALGDMPALWDNLGATVANVVEKPPSCPSRAATAPPSIPPTSDDASSSLTSSSEDRVHAIVHASERMWTMMEAGDPARALSIYKHVRQLSLHDDNKAAEMGFLALDVATLDEFPPRIVACAKHCLQVPHMSAAFYAHALSVLADLDDASPSTQVTAFFHGQLAAVDAVRTKRGSSSAVGLVVVLRILLAALAHAHTIFTAPHDAAALGFLSHVETAATDWAIAVLRHVRHDLHAHLQSLADVDAVAALEARVRPLCAVASPLVQWSRVALALDDRAIVTSSVWAAALDDLFARQTKALFADAFDAAAAQFKGAVGRGGDASATFVDRLLAIQARAAAAPSLQPVVADECTRVLFDVVTHLGAKKLDPQTLLAIAPVCLDLATAVPRLFLPRGPASAPLSRDVIQAAFDRLADTHDARLPPAQWPALCESLRVPLPSFSWLDPSPPLSLPQVHFLVLVQGGGGAALGPVFEALARQFCSDWANDLVHTRGQALHEVLATRFFGYSNEAWRSVYHACWTYTRATTPGDMDDEMDDDATKVWLPWCATPMLSQLLFSVATALASVLPSSSSMPTTKSTTDVCREQMKSSIRTHLQAWTRAYVDAVLARLSTAKPTTVASSPFGEACVLQCIFDLYFVRMVGGDSSFVRFGWGDTDDQQHDMAPLLAWIDPVDWELYGPPLVQLVARQFYMTRLLFSVFLPPTFGGVHTASFVPDADLSMLEVAAPVPRFSLLPVPQPVKRVASAPRLPPPVNVKDDGPRPAPPVRHSSSGGGGSSSLHHILSSSTSLLTGSATAASVTASAASAAAKGMSLFSSAASSYLRE
ncbi:Aste57867_14372 [Aphanomyces stellatus]|uniref:Conserved oligomeric Golgi complex subunit 1 n=1 Tax=Aphanomyces stellatus TaxID=120398 RepID=A0A485L0I2_9STRA|nr:hypothetical protein As57867_014318 [Aphanomyces stellatus]VFT91195.1 Aste57867_14372 [Aphanomyces stellatus]